MLNNINTIVAPKPETRMTKVDINLIPEADLDKENDEHGKIIDIQVENAKSKKTRPHHKPIKIKKRAGSKKTDSGLKKSLSQKLEQKKMK